jgi:hemolysin III
MVALGGVLYYAGGLVYISRRPNPFPRVFGYHEVFHVLELGGTGAFYAAIAVYVLPS